MHKTTGNAGDLTFPGNNCRVLVQKGIAVPNRVPSNSVAQPLPALLKTGAALEFLGITQDSITWSGLYLLPHEKYAGPSAGGRRPYMFRTLDVVRVKQLMTECRIGARVAIRVRAAELSGRI